MAWLAVNKDGTEWIMPEKPVRGPVWALGVFGRSVQCTNRDRTPQRDCLQTSRQRTDMG